MSKEPFDLLVDGKYILKPFHCHEWKEDSQSPSGIMIKVSLIGGPPYYWIPWHFHCDNDEIDKDGYLALDLAVSAIDILCAVDPDINEPKYAFARHDGTHFYRPYCHGARKAEVSGNPFPNPGRKIWIDIRDASTSFFRKEWLARDLGLEEGVSWDVVFWPNCIRMAVDDPDILYIGAWRFNLDDSKILKFKIYTNPVTTEDKKVVYPVSDIEFLGVIETLYGSINDLWAEKDFYKPLIMTDTGGVSNWEFGDVTCGDWTIGVYTFSGARVLSKNNIIYVKDDPSDEWPNKKAFDSIEGSPLDGLDACGRSWDGKYFTYPIGMISTFHQNASALKLNDGWYPDEQPVKTTRYGNVPQDFLCGYFKKENGIWKSTGFGTWREADEGIIGSKGTGFGILFKGDTPQQDIFINCNKNNLIYDPTQNYLNFMHGAQTTDFKIFPYIEHYKGKL